MVLISLVASSLLSSDSFGYTGATTPSIKSGWNLLGNASNNYVNPSDFTITGEGVWTYTKQDGWKEFESIKPNQGFWYKSKINRDGLEFPNNGDGTASGVKFVSGEWVLMTTNEATILGDIKEQTSATRGWTYINNTWYSSDSTIIEAGRGVQLRDYQPTNSNFIEDVNAPTNEKITLSSDVVVIDDSDLSQITSMEENEDSTITINLSNQRAIFDGKKLTVGQIIIASATAPIKIIKIIGSKIIAEEIKDYCELVDNKVAYIIGGNELDFNKPYINYEKDTYTKSS